MVPLRLRVSEVYIIIIYYGQKLYIYIFYITSKQEREVNKMSLQIKTDRELDEFEEMRYLTWREEENLNFLIYRSDYGSFFPFAYRDKTEGERFVGYAGAVCTADKEDDSFQNPFPKDVDIYICPNGMKSPYKRTVDGLLSVQNLVIDIDSHQTTKTIKELNEHIKGFENRLLDKIIIQPNYINRTGRGLQLWFCIESCHIALNKICMSVIDMLCNHIEEIMKELKESELSIDRASSLKLNGLFRLPYTYNTKAQRWAEGRLLHEELPNINELKEVLKENNYKSRYFGEKKCKKENVVVPRKYRFVKKLKDNDYTPCLIHRKKFMEYLFKTRDVEVGSRDIMMFAMYSTVVKLLNKDDARAYCIELNDTLKQPLRYSELCMIFKEIDRKQHRFTVERFFTFVNATSEERKWFYKLTNKEEQRQAKRNVKKERNIKVKELRDQGYTIVAISKELGISRPTIYKILDSE